MGGSESWRTDGRGGFSEGCIVCWCWTPKVIASATGQMRVCAKDVSEGSCERCGSVTDSVPKLKVTGVFKDGEGGEMRVYFFGDVAEKAVRMTVEEAADMENEAVENGDADRS